MGFGASGEIADAYNKFGINVEATVRAPGT
jgi:hypothetical protein